MATATNRTPGMRVSAIRFGVDVWRLLEAEAARLGVSVSQYVREAALMRATAAITARGEDPALSLAGAVERRAESPAPAARSSAQRARAVARKQRADAAAVNAQARQAHRHAEQARRASE